MKMKRIMALVMTSAMVMGTLAGCGASTDTTDTTQSQSENSSTVAAATKETASEEKEWYGTKDGKTVTLQFWGGIQPEYGYDEVVENFNKEYADKGVQVEYNRYVNNSDGNLQKSYARTHRRNMYLMMVLSGDCLLNLITMHISWLTKICLTKPALKCLMKVGHMLSLWMQ